MFRVFRQDGTVISPEREVVTHEDAQPNRACQAEALVVCVANSDRESASLETGFQVENAEHLHRVTRYSELFPNHTDVAVTQGSTKASTTAVCGIGRCVAVAGGVGSCASSARVILLVHEISVLVSDIRFSSQKLSSLPTQTLCLITAPASQSLSSEASMTTIRAAFYARVSGEQQAAAHTIESQIAALSEPARFDGTPVPPERQFVDDGYSGATLIRPALDRLRDLVSVAAIDKIYVHSPDRLARNYAYQVLLLDEWRRRGVELVFLNRPLGQSPEDDLLLQVQGIVAEYERAKIMERSRRGKKHAAQSGSLNVMSGAPFGYRYVSVREGGGQARFERVAEQARVVQQIFAWIGRDRYSLAEVCRRLRKAGTPTANGKLIWSREAVWHILQNPAYMGQAAYGKTHMMPRGKKSRLRAARGHPSEPRRSNAPKPADPKEWVFVPVPAIVDEALFRAAHAQLAENRSRARQGRRRPGYLLQGLTSCAKCGYAYYGKTLRQLGAGRQMKDFLYYRCSGSDGYRFGGRADLQQPAGPGRISGDGGVAPSLQSRYES